MRNFEIFQWRNIPKKSCTNLENTPLKLNEFSESSRGWVGVVGSRGWWGFRGWWRWRWGSRSRGWWGSSGWWGLGVGAGSGDLWGGEDLGVVEVQGWGWEVGVQGWSGGGSRGLWYPGGAGGLGGPRGAGVGVQWVGFLDVIR